MNESSNPVFSDKAVSKFVGAESTGHMTVAGSLIKTTYALFVLVATAAFSWSLAPSIINTMSWWSWTALLIVAFVLGMVAIFRANFLTVTLYAIAEGAILGVISALFGALYNGIVAQAVLLTLTTTVGMLFLYATGIVKVTQKLRSVIFIATVGVMLYLFVELIVSFFSPAFVSVVTSGWAGIAIAAVIVIIAALNLLLDFDFITKGAEQKLPKKVEWYAAFGLMVTIIWLYISILRLLAASRR